MGRRRGYDRRDLPPNLYVRNGYYSYRDPDTGREFGLGRDRRAAITEAIQVNLDFFRTEERKPLSVRIAGVNTITFHAWLDRYKVVISGRGLKPKTLTDYASKLRAIREKIDDVPITEITTKQIAGILNEYADQGKASMAKLLRSTLSDIFREAIVDGHISDNPVSATRSAKATVKRSRMTADEFICIKKSAETLPAWVGLAMDLAVITGQRIGDLAKMHWDDIRDGLLYVEQGKTGAKLAIPVSLSMEALDISLSHTLEKCRTLGGETILSSSKREPLSTKAISRYFLQARTSSGLTFEGNPPSFHEIRSLSARLYTKQFGRDFAKHLLGHKSDNMAAKYGNDRGREWDVIDAS